MASPAENVGGGGAGHDRLSVGAIASFLIALAALAAGLFLAAHHPLSPTAAMAGCLMAAILCMRLDRAWLLLLPALLPIVDLAPWTGWLSFEEFDILALGAAAGAWLRHGWAPGKAAQARPSSALLILVSVYLLLLGIALARGIANAGGFEFGWFQGYEGPMNSVRLAKSFLLAALFSPLLGRSMSRLDPHGIVFLGWGMALGLATVSLAAVWERLAFPGLLNFSADYRTTALFWEMHVGGAALDGFLALTLPFAVLLMLRSKHIGQFVPASLILGLGIYASLTTFSRGVYIAVAVSLGLMALLPVGRKPSHAAAGTSRGKAALIGLISASAAAGLAFLVFRHGGYRALLAVLGCFAMVMLTMEHARFAGGRAWAATGAIAVLLTLSAFALTWLMEKGAYWSYAALFALAVTAHLVGLRTRSSGVGKLALAGTAALPFAAALIANHWGGMAALTDTTVALAAIVLPAVWGIRSTRSVWPSDWRRQGAVLASAMAIAAIVAIFGGGTYMGERFSTSERDLEGRLQHWRAGLDLLRTPGDRLFGKGLGRFPPSFFFGAPGNEFPGSYQLNREDRNTYITLSGPRYQIGFGEVLRVVQRVAPVAAGRYTLEFDARTQGKVQLDFSICAKHLLYAENCFGRQFIETGNDGWQHRKIEFDGRNLSAGPWFAPQLVVFSVASETMSSRIDLDNLSLTDPYGDPILANGDFSEDMARWFFTSDHHHLPWHMKNMFLHVLFEQGALGLGIFVILIMTALLRSLVGTRAHHPLGPALVAAIVGFMVVGLFDSLIDVPRVAFLFFLLLLIAIQGRKAS